VSAADIYTKSIAGAEHFLAQAEILSDLIFAHLELSSLGTSQIRIFTKQHPLAIILTQGCELEQDFKARRRQVPEDKLVPCILFCELNLASQMRDPKMSSNIWNRISQNNDERYHFFQAVDQDQDTQGEGLPELGVDFKRLFAIPTDEVYWRISTGEVKRRCLLKSPYLEHFCRRFANFLSRVALPDPHMSVR
jgi:hypothetical protein